MHDSIDFQQIINKNSIDVNQTIQKDKNTLLKKNKASIDSKILSHDQIE